MPLFELVVAHTPTLAKAYSVEPDDLEEQHASFEGGTIVQLRRHLEAQRRILDEAAYYRPEHVRKVNPREERVAVDRELPGQLGPRARLARRRTPPSFRPKRIRLAPGATASTGGATCSVHEFHARSAGLANVGERGSGRPPGNIGPDPPAMHDKRTPGQKLAAIMRTVDTLVPGATGDMRGSCGAWEPGRGPATSSRVVSGSRGGCRSAPRAPPRERSGDMDSSALGLEAVLYAIAGVVVGMILAGVIVAVAASWLGGRQFSLLSIGMGLVVAIATVVDVVVIWRAVAGEVTGWDLLWAAVLTLAAVWSVRRLASPPHRSAGGR